MTETLPVCTMSWPQIAGIILCMAALLGPAVFRQLVMKWRHGPLHSVFDDIALSGESPPRPLLVLIALAFVLAAWPFFEGESLTSCRRAGAPQAAVSPDPAS